MLRRLDALDGLADGLLPRVLISQLPQSGQGRRKDIARLAYACAIGACAGARMPTSGMPVMRLASSVSARRSSGSRS